MKAYGFEKIRYNFVDNHPPKGSVNWWEADFENVNKKRERRKAKKELREYFYDGA